MLSEGGGGVGDEKTIGLRSSQKSQVSMEVVKTTPGDYLEPVPIYM